MSEEQKEVQPEEEAEEETDSGETETSIPQMTTQEIERQEEAKLKAKYPQAVRPMGGHSAFLQKRLAKGQQKYFDSGDYQMAKQKVPPAMARLPPVLSQPTGDTIPTPESVPMRKTSIIQQSKLASSNLT